MDYREAVSLSDGLIGCRHCGRRIEATEAIYSSDGEPICQACSLATGTVPDPRQVRQLCIGTLVMGALSVVCNPLFVSSVVTLVLWSRSRRQLTQDATRASLGDGHRTMSLVAGAGGVLAVVGALLWLVLMLFVALALLMGEGMRRAL